MNDVDRVPLNKRGTIRSTAAALSIPKSTLYRNFQHSEIRRRRKTVKPSLTLANMVEREEFCMASIKDDKTTFHDMMNIIHIDKKWFYLTKNSEDAIWGPKRVNLIGRKKYRIKVIILAAVACPRWNTATNIQFDEKIGIWPFTIMETAKKETAIMAQVVPLS